MIDSPPNITISPDYVYYYIPKLSLWNSEMCSGVSEDHIVLRVTSHQKVADESFLKFGIHLDLALFQAIKKTGQKGIQ